MILVTGATGKIGLEVVRLLGEAGAPARALLRNPDKAKGWKGIEVVKGDLDDSASVAAALAGVDTVFLLSNANPKQEKAVIEAAVRASVKKIVKISSMGANADSKVNIARGHAESEAALKQSGVAWTILRPGMFSQNFLNFAHAIKAQGQFTGSVKDGRVAPIDARDIAAVAVKALLEPGHEGKTYVLTGAESITHAEAAEHIGAAIGKPVRYVDVPLEETRAAILGHGLPAWLAEDMVTFQTGIAAGGSNIIAGDVEKVLGRKPLSFADFARDYAAAFQ
ncbi:Hypothetical protein A7982_06996 [Minicystis rosea]|nr:Hypothetical protein A7982_06996 [Minicystis rosea]